MRAGAPLSLSACVKDCAGTRGGEARASFSFRDGDAYARVLPLTLCVNWKVARASDCEAACVRACVRACVPRLSVCVCVCEHEGARPRVTE
jgi:hypothetical protein